MSKSMLNPDLAAAIVTEPDFKFSKHGQAIWTVSIPVSRQWTDKDTEEKKEKTQWWRVTAWGKTAESLASLAKKGAVVAFKFREIEARAYDSKNGAAASLEATVSEFRVLHFADNGVDRMLHDENGPEEDLFNDF